MPLDGPLMLPPLFDLSSFGAVTNRDAGAFNSSGETLRKRIEDQVAFYNAQIEALQNGAPALARDPVRFKWDGTMEQRAGKGVRAEALPSAFRLAVYRPFFRQHFHMGSVLNNSIYPLPRIFPTHDTRTRSILVERGLRAPGRAPAVLAVDAVPEGAIAGASGQPCQVLPRYTYDEPAPGGPEQSEMLPRDARDRRDNISTEALAAHRAHVGEDVTSDQVFAYVYGVLHSPEYRARYADDLARLLPRIPDPKDRATFLGFAEAGQRLLDLHIGYEEHAAPVPPRELLSCMVWLPLSESSTGAQSRRGLGAIFPKS